MNASRCKWLYMMRSIGLYGLTLPLLFSTALAEPQAATQHKIPLQLREIVVTAQKVRQNIQDVPIAISAFTARQLRHTGITTLAGLSAQVPGVTLTAGTPFTGGNTMLSASIRGIGQSDFAMNINQAVGVYLDGIYLPLSVGANVNMLNVARIEIDKGPQGTLFGANTIGGAINIVTHTPGEKPRLIAQVTGGSFDRRDVAFTADIPLIKHKLLASIRPRAILT